jgi:hypothetical protein
MVILTASVAAGKENDQFSGVFMIDQDVNADNLAGKSVGDAGVAQGGNVVTGMAAVGVGQIATLQDDLDLEMKGGNRNTQGLNVVQGKAAQRVGQVGMVDDDVRMESESNTHSAQGVNVINACEGCR